jgi:uncharacterized membrane-anchored protein YhcB (DUF1043 family)
MTTLLGQVFVFVLLAFLLGVVVGWMFWRYRRVSVADEDWSAVRAELEALHAQLDGLQRERESLAGQAARASGELERLQRILTGAWHDRDLLRLELHRATDGLAQARADLERTTAQARYLQRRVTELSISAVRRDSAPPRPLPPSEALRALGELRNGAREDRLAR